MNPVYEVYFHLSFPLRLLSYSAYYLPITVYQLLINFQFSTFLSPSTVKSLWFANFWKWFGPLNAKNAAPRVQPYIELAHGVVIDVGPATGEWLKLFDKTKVTKIYGVEPNRDHHELLRKRIIEAGLSDVYVIVPVGIEDLDGKGLYGGEQRQGGWVPKGEVDSIVTVLCLCSIPNPRATIKGLYSYLKEGGTWIVYEHIITRHRFVKYYQALIDIIWPHFLGGCSITRDTGTWLKEAGSWTKVDLRSPADEPSYGPLPHAVGTLTK